MNALLFGIGLAWIPVGPVEAARIDGASGCSMFPHIYWPMLRPLTTVVVGLAIVGNLKTFDVVYAMTKGGRLASRKCWRCVTQRTFSRGMALGQF